MPNDALVESLIAPRGQAPVEPPRPTGIRAASPQVSRRKALLARSLAWSGLTGLLERVRHRLRPEVRILAYHRVWDVASPAGEGGDDFPYDIELISASTKEFRWQMQYVRRHFHPITFDTLLSALDGKTNLPPRPVIVTFDDGYEDNYSEVYPILRAVGVPATIFLATSYIGGDQTFWYDRLAHLVLTTPASSVCLPWQAQPIRLHHGRAGRRNVLVEILGMLKRVRNDLRLSALQQIESELGGLHTSPPSLESRPMNWDQVRQMSRGGIEFGSHTCTHPVLANLNEAELQIELTESKRRIELETGRAIEVLAYPVGGKTAFNDQVQKAAQEAGYRLAVAYLPGINPLKRLDRFGLRRLRVERYLDRATFAAMLHLPEVFG